MDIEGYNMPEDLYYESNHFWVRMEGDVAVMGMDDFAQKLAGEVVFVGLPPEGKKLKQFKNFAKVESGKWLGKVYAPLTGELVAVNEDLEMKAKLINEDCYGAGWMYKIKPSDMAEMDNLIHGEEALKKWIKEEMEKYADQIK
jgi:glycine cleavage system H protein